MFDELVHILVRDIGKSLLDVYHLYYPHELKHVRDAKLSQKASFEFLKEFELCPGTITKSQAFHAY